MKYLVFFLVAIVIGEMISYFILFPIFDTVYEPYLEYDFALKSLVWLVLYILIPTAIGGVVEFSIMKLLGIRSDD